MCRPFLVLSLAFATVCSTARAVPKSAPTEYKTAVKLENDGKLAEALAAFHSLPDANEDFDVRLHIGSCLRKLGRLKDARAVYLAIVNDPAADQPTRETAASDLDDLAQRFPKLKISATDNTRGVVIAVDGVAVIAPAFESVDPGERVVEATREGRTVFARKVFATEGAVIEVIVDAPLADGPPRTPSNAVSSVSEDLDRVSASPGRTIGLIGLGVGAVGVGLGTVFLLRADGLRSESDELAANGDPAALDRTDSARSAQLAARISFGVGIVAAATGTVLLVTSRRSGTTAPATALKIGPSFVSFEGAW